MFKGKIVGFNHFVSKAEGKADVQKVRISFEDTDLVPEVGKMYRSFNFRVDKIPAITKDCIGKECFYDTGKFDGNTYGNDLRF